MKHIYSVVYNNCVPRQSKSKKETLNCLRSCLQRRMKSLASPHNRIRLVFGGGSCCCCLIFFSVDLLELQLFGGNTFLTPFACLAHLLASGLGLVAQHLCTLLLGLLLVNVFHQDALVLEHVTLALHVQVVVQVAIDLFAVPVLLEQAAQDALTLHPQEFGGHAGVGCTLALTETAVTSLSAGFGVLANAVAGVHDDGLLDDETILDQFADVLSCGSQRVNRL